MPKKQKNIKIEAKDIKTRIPMDAWRKFHSLPRGAHKPETIYDRKKTKQEMDFEVASLKKDSNAIQQKFNEITADILNWIGDIHRLDPSADKHILKMLQILNDDKQEFSQKVKEVIIALEAELEVNKTEIEKNTKNMLEKWLYYLKSF